VVMVALRFGHKQVKLSPTVFTDLTLKKQTSRLYKNPFKAGLGRISGKSFVVDEKVWKL